MRINIKIPESCSEAALQEGRAICQQESFLPYVGSVLPDGGTILRAKICDSFNFVDHPELAVDASGEKVLRFHCDCPDYRVSRRFCAHCAAVALAFAEQERPIPVAAWTGHDKPKEAASSEKEPTAEDAGVPRLMDFSYTFRNSGEDLYPGIPAAKRRIPLKRYIQAFGDHARATALYKFMGVWGGSCYGISATASMLQQAEEGTSISDFSATARIPSELRLADYNQTIHFTLHQFIELLHILQLSPIVSVETNNHLNEDFRECIKLLAERVEAFQHGEMTPTMMLVFGDVGGHAVLPFHLSRTQGAEDILCIYDPNWPMTIRFAYLEKDEAGNYLNWRFPMSDDMVFSSKTGEKITMSSYENYKAAWDNRGDPAENAYLQAKAGVTIKNTAGATLARVTDTGVESYREDIYQILITGGGRSGDAMISLPVGNYVFCMEDSRQEELSVTLTGLDISVEVTTQAREAHISVEDADVSADVEIVDPNSQYSIKILDTTDGAQEETALYGITGAEALHLVLKSGQLYASGLTDQSTLYIDDEQQPLNRIAQFVEEDCQDDRNEELVFNTSSDEKTEGSASDPDHSKK